MNRNSYNNDVLRNALDIACSLMNQIPGQNPPWSPQILIDMAVTQMNERINRAKEHSIDLTKTVNAQIPKGQQ
jgi:hypothetical protein